MPSHYLEYLLNEKDTVQAYRMYYVLDKPFVKWKNRPVPEWYLEGKEIASRLFSDYSKLRMEQPGP
jgi:hypothetical protein